MNNHPIRIGTRESQLAVWQASLVQELLRAHHIKSELVYIKSDGDVDLATPLYEMGVQGIFTKTLDAALLSGRIDLAVHSMKDVPIQLAQGLTQAAVLPRASYKDLLVYKGNETDLVAQLETGHALTIATSSIRRKAQWLNRYPHHHFQNLRGNVNTRLRKLDEEDWNGAIFAAAGLERIGLRPSNSMELDWMLPAPAQGAIVVVCKKDDSEAFDKAVLLNDEDTALCTKIERDFLKALLGGCATPISALAVKNEDTVFFEGNILSPDGKQKIETSLQQPVASSQDLGQTAASQLMQQGAQIILDQIKHAGI